MRKISIVATLVAVSTLTLAQPALEGKLVPDAQGQQWAKQTLNSLSLEEKVGQMLQVRYFADYSTFDSADYMSLRDEITQYHVGSVTLGLHFNGPNLVKVTPVQAAATVNQLQADSKIPLLVAADLERGLASRLDGVPSFPFAMAFGADGDPADAYQFGLKVAQEARAVGFNWAMAPVADVNSDPANPIINTRSFGDDPGAVGDLVAAFIKGAHAGGLLVTVKHFPGHGSAALDSHKTLLTITANRPTLESVDFLPFEKAIDSGVDAILVEHARVPALDPDSDHVASISPEVINDVLKRQLGFSGIVITDAMEMRGLTELYLSHGQNPIARSAVDAAKAGNDVVALPANTGVAFHAIVDAVHSGEVSENRIDESVLKILQAKAALGLNKWTPINLDGLETRFKDHRDFGFAQTVADESLTLVRNNQRVLPVTKQEQTSGDALAFIIFKSNVLSDAGQAFQDSLQQRVPKAKVFVVDPRLSDDLGPKVLEAVKEAKKVVIVAYVSHTSVHQELIDGTPSTQYGLFGGSRVLLSSILADAGEKVAVVAAGNPYLILSFPRIATYLCTYSTSPTSDISMERAIFGDLDPKGKLPINIPGVAKRGTSLSWAAPR